MSPRIPKFSSLLAKFELEPHLVLLDEALLAKNEAACCGVLDQLHKVRRASYGKWLNALRMIDFSKHQFDYHDLQAVMRQYGQHGMVTKWPTSMGEQLGYNVL